MRQTRGPDTDMHGIQDGTEPGYAVSDIGPDTDTAFFQPDMDTASPTNPLNDDSDSDGVPDRIEDSLKKTMSASQGGV